MEELCAEIWIGAAHRNEVRHSQAVATGFDALSSANADPAIGGYLFGGGAAQLMLQPVGTFARIGLKVRVAAVFSAIKGVGICE